MDRSQVDRVSASAGRVVSAVRDLELEGGVSVTVSVGGSHESEVSDVANGDYLVQRDVLSRVEGVVVVSVEEQRTCGLVRGYLDVGDCRPLNSIGVGEVTRCVHVDDVLCSRDRLVAGCR